MSEKNYNLLRSNLNQKKMFIFKNWRQLIQLKDIKLKIVGSYKIMKWEDFVKIYLFLKMNKKNLLEERGQQFWFGIIKLFYLVE